MIELWKNQIKEDDFILDIGCWDGKRVLELWKKTKNVYGMDVNASKFVFAPKEIQKNLYFGDVTKKIPFKKKFNWIILTEVLEHVSNDALALENIYQSLKKGGKLILSTPRSIRFLEFWDPAWIRWKLLKGQKHHHYAKKELFGKLNKNKFLIKEYQILGNALWIIARWWNVFLRYGLKSKKQINYPMKKGFCDWFILAEKIK
ncbi:class I SAM-dependent methyltransferase [Candidatus Pacearchaeota archaeon]|nr:class I SAM-dependent methyltransferase [Candidatus Pacearchaeota archaeon]